MFHRALMLLSMIICLMAVTSAPAALAHRFEPPEEIEVVEGETAELLVVDDTGCPANLQALILDDDIATVSPESATERVRKKFTVTGVVGAAGEETYLRIDVQGVGFNPQGEPCEEDSYTLLKVRVLPRPPNFRAAGRRIDRMEEEEVESLKLDLQSLLEDFEADCKTLIEDLDNDQIDAEQAAVELLEGTAEALNDAYLRTGQAATNVVERAAQHPKTAAALEERDACADDPTCPIGPKLERFIDNTTPGGCADWDDFSHDIQKRFARTAGKIAEEVKRWAKKIESRSEEIAEQDPDEPAITIRPQTTQAPQSSFTPPTPNPPSETIKFTTLTHASYYTARTARLGNGEEIHTLRVSGVHDPAYGFLEIIVKGTELNGESFEKTMTLDTLYSDCKFDLQYGFGIPRGDYLVTVRPTEPGPVVSSSKFLSVR